MDFLECQKREELLLVFRIVNPSRQFLLFLNFTNRKKRHLNISGTVTKAY